MNTKCKQTSKWLGVTFLASLTSVCSYAQDEAADEEIFELSPFTVDASQDEGYRAGSTIAGSRLNTELKDVAASVTVLTEAFLDDLGDTDLLTGLSMVAGVETDLTTDQTGPSLSQGYIGGDFGDRNASDNSVRVRGLGRTSTSANFIEVRGSLDRYNMERPEFLRGPNSILFGLGRPAGLVNYTTKRASLHKDLNSVGIVVDNFGTQSLTADVSRVLIEDKLAARAITKYSDGRYMFDTAFQRDKRLFLTATYKPTKNTTLMGYYEDVESTGRRPNYRPVQDNVSGWLELWNKAHADGWSEDQIANNFYWDPFNSMTSNGDAPRAPDITVPERESPGEFFNPQLREGLDGNDKALTAFYDSTDWTTPIDGLLTRLGTRTVTGGQPSNSGSVRARTQFQRSNDPYEDEDAGYVDRQAIDQGIFPYKDVDISSLPGNRRDNDNQKAYLSLEHKFTDNLFGSISYQKETNSQDQIFSPIAQQQSISLDVNTLLPDGRENPNFLRPFIYGRAIAAYSQEKAESYLAQVNYQLDFAEKSDRLNWLGKHNITGFMSGQREDRHYYRYGLMGEYQAGVLASGGADNSTRHVYPVYYVGNAVKPGDTSLNFTGFPTDTTAYRDQEYYYNYYTNEDSARGDWRVSPEKLKLKRVLFLNSPTRSLKDAGGYGASLQSYIWGGRIVSTLGWRDDTVDTFNFERVRYDANGNITTDTSGTIDPDPFDDIQDGSIRSDYVRPQDATFSLSQPTITKGLVFHATPWMRFFGNESENFDVSNPVTDNFNRAIDPPSGVTKEFGVGFLLFENKLDIKFNMYETAQVGTTEGVGTSIARNRINSFEDTLFNALSNQDQDGLYDITNWEAVAGWDYATNSPIIVNGSRAPGIDENGDPLLDAEGNTLYEYFGEYDAPNDVASIQDSVSEGWELSASWNPNRAWRFSANLSRLENRTSNRQSLVLDYIDYRSSFWGPFFAAGTHQNGDTDATVYGPDDTPAGESTLLSERFLSIMGNELLADLEAEGVSNPGISEYSARITANRSFHDGFLQGFSFGTNLRWESGKVIGNALKDATTNLGGLSNQPTKIADPANAFTGDTHITGGVMMNYKKKIFGDKVDWRIQLNVANLFKEGDDFRVIRVRPDESPIYGLNNPTTYQLSNNFKF